jgi:hypothetical protein
LPEPLEGQGMKGGSVLTSKVSGYPLVNIQNTMENHHFFMEIQKTMENHHFLMILMEKLTINGHFQ